VLSCYWTTNNEDEVNYSCDDDDKPQPLVRDEYKDCAASVAVEHMESMDPAMGIKQYLL
jgi:hypothetical protein